jgi:hypothetical protein
MTQPVSIHVYNLTKPEFKSVCWHQFLGYKKKHMIIISFDEYTVYIMFWIMVLYDWYCIIVIVYPNIIAFCSVRLMEMYYLSEYTPTFRFLKITS